MTQKSSPAKSTKKHASRRTVDTSRITDPDQLMNQGLSQADVIEQPLENRRITILIWFLSLSAGLILVGLLVQDIPQPLDAIRWLIYRRGYPYFQASSLSALLIAASVMIPGADLARLKKIDHWIARLLLIILELLQKISSGYRSNLLWKILFSLSVASFIISLWFARCLSANDILVAFDIFENGNLVKHVSPGETVLYAPARYVEIEAKLEASLYNLPPPHVTCEWTTYTGDGRLVQSTNCKINYQTGTDGRSDPVVVNISQNGCPSSGYHSFFISKTQ